MRTLFTIFRYELLMQVKSLRFKGMCLLSLLFAFGLYQAGLSRQELIASQTFLDEEALPFYLLAMVFTGLFPMARIRKTGMHPILMVRPFSTFILALGQMLAALVSLLIPCLILFFPAGLLLHWQIEIEYPLAPLFYVLLFYFIPGMCCILSITIWIRTCFKNNIISLIILGFVFAGTALLANSFLLNYQTGYASRGRIHNFVPMVSLFSETYWEQVEHMETRAGISFFKPGDWLNLFLSGVYSCLFLLLSCYHLRRTEPHRKVLGTYGRHWYHIPTFLKVACDLKIDPHVGIKSHIILVLLFGAILTKTGFPLARPLLQRYLFKREARMNLPPDVSPDEIVKRYSADRIPEDKILNVKILESEETATKNTVESRLTFVCDHATSDSMAIINPWGRWDSRVEQILVGGDTLDFINIHGLYWIEGREMEPYCNGTSHTMTLHAKTREVVTGGGVYLDRFMTRGYFFVKKKRSYTFKSLQSRGC